ncbi:diguanylate cyclase [Casimicrobium huifangae]|uniref:diguanylate cyclase n=1 Tax=Casimicrobium huifangae TaxID=2591109 RepID=UPI003783C6A8
MLDPLSAFVFATLFSLLNGAVLGFIHPALTPDLQPSSADWRVGTLLVAGGSALFIGQAATGANWVLPLANGAWLVGLALYWRAVRRLFAVPDSHWIYLPVLAGTFGNVVFVYAVPSVAYRVAVATVCWVAIIGGAVATLLRHRDRDRSISARVLTGIFILLAALMLARGVYYVVAGRVVVSIAQPLNWVNALTPLLVAVLPVIGTTAFVLLCFERIRAELHRAATTDALTGLPNRRTITERASVLLALAHAGQQPFSVAVIDVDHFKAINDQHGHDIGDLVLQAVAASLRAHCRGEEVVGRQGGEEFVALLPEADAAGAHRAAERLRTAVADQSVAVGPDTSLQVTVSIGIATGTSNSLPDFDTLLKRADMALYDAKANGRNRVCAAS